MQLGGSGVVHFVTLCIQSQVKLPFWVDRGGGEVRQISKLARNWKLAVVQSTYLFKLWTFIVEVFHCNCDTCFSSPREGLATINHIDLNRKLRKEKLQMQSNKIDKLWQIGIRFRFAMIMFVL